MMIERLIKLLPALLGLLVISACAMTMKDSKPLPMVDIHIHYNWNHEEVISPQQVIDILREHNVVLAVVSSRPSDYALKLRAVGGDQILAFWSPYFKTGIRETWFIHPEVLNEARRALASGEYAGIGEFHLVAGMGPRRDHPVVQGLIELAEEFKVPVLIHTDAGNYEYFLPICRDNPNVRFLWAHAGGYVGPEVVAPLMERCPNVWVELSARDPWHYGNFTDPQNQLLPGWKALFETYPHRFMVGTDPVWNAHQVYRWYEADEGWSHYSKLDQYHRGWLEQLPTELARNIRLSNALRFFQIKPR